MKRRRRRSHLLLLLSPRPQGDYPRPGEAVVASASSTVLVRTVQLTNGKKMLLKFNTICICLILPGMAAASPSAPLWLLSRGNLRCEQAVSISLPLSFLLPPLPRRNTRRCRSNTPQTRIPRPPPVFVARRYRGWPGRWRRKGNRIEGGNMQVGKRSRAGKALGNGIGGFLRL